MWPTCSRTCATATRASSSRRSDPRRRGLATASARQGARDELRYRGSERAPALLPRVEHVAALEVADRQPSRRIGIEAHQVPQPVARVVRRRHVVTAVRAEGAHVRIEGHPVAERVGRALARREEVTLRVLLPGLVHFEAEQAVLAVGADTDL